MRVIEISDGVSGYKQVVDFVMLHGDRREPRGIRTLDAGPITVVMDDVTQSLPLGVGRNASRKIGATEAIQLIGGFSSPEMLFDASPNFKQFVEPDTGRFHGAYGTRISNQLTRVVTKLRYDKDSRQAVVTLWDPWLDNLPAKKDYPCTVMFHFAIIHDTLELTTTMRSQDVWLGAPFDWFQFTQMQQTIARILDVEPGVYRHITLSTHVYATNFADTEKLTDTPNKREWQPRGIGRSGDSIHIVRERARRIAVTVADMDDMTDSERWYRDQFKPKQQSEAKAA